MTTPVELYQFIGSHRQWDYTSADEKMDYDGIIYLPIAIGRDEIESKNELSKANITVTVSLDNVMGKELLRNSVDDIVSLTIYSKDIETDNVMVAWKGRLASVKPNDKSIQLYFESIFTSLRRAGVRQRYQRTCPHVLYGNGCRANPDNFSAVGVATIVDGINLTIPEAAGFADGWFTGGMITNLDGTPGLRFIISHIGSSIRLVRPLESIEAGHPAQFFPGCDRSTATCKNKFNNILNNGSFPYIPNKNPFSITSLV